MSEYQYFEFAAIDRPLTDGEMAALRAVSTRAVITPSGFVNHYEWGGLKADPLDWLRRYFDAFVYLADWAHCRFALRLPRDMFGKAELKPFGVKQSLTIDASEDHWILDWSLEGSDNYDRFAEDDGRGWMGRLVPLRDELIRDDQRSLYLGWLAGAAKGEVPETTLEPTVPAGLSQLSAAQNALAAFLEIDADIIAAAAIGSADASDRPESVDAWLQSLSPDELRSMLKSIVRADRPNPQREVASRYRAWHRQHAPQAARDRAGPRELARPRPQPLQRRAGAGPVGGGAHAGNVRRPHGRGPLRRRVVRPRDARPGPRHPDPRLRRPQPLAAPW